MKSLSITNLNIEKEGILNQIYKIRGNLLSIEYFTLNNNDCYVFTKVSSGNLIYNLVFTEFTLFKKFIHLPDQESENLPKEIIYKNQGEIHFLDSFFENTVNYQLTDFYVKKTKKLEIVNFESVNCINESYLLLKNHKNYF